MMLGLIEIMSILDSDFKLVNCRTKIADFNVSYTSGGANVPDEYKSLNGRFGPYTILSVLWLLKNRDDFHTNLAFHSICLLLQNLCVLG